MSGEPRSPLYPGSSRPLPRFILFSILLLCSVFPPETRGESAAGCAALAGLLYLATLKDRASLPGAELALLLTLAACVFALFSAQARGAAIEPMAVALFAGALGVMAAARAASLREGNTLLWLLALAGTLVAVHALYQWAHGLEALVREIERTPAVPARELVLARLREGRAFGPFATPAALGGFLALVMPATVVLALGAGKVARPLLLCIVALEAGALLASASATAALSLTLALAIGLGRARRLVPRVLVAVGVGFLLLCAGIVAMRGGKMIDLQHPESPWRLRAGNMRAAATMLRDHPWVGVGPGGFGEAFPGYRQAGDNETRHAHSLPLELLAETGLVAGLCLSIVFYALFLGPLVSGPLRGPPLAFALSIGLGAFALQNLADFTAFFPSLLILAVILRATLAREGDPAPSAGSVAPMLTRLGMLASGLVLAASGLAWNDRVEARRALVEQDTALAERLARRAVRMAPWDPDGHLLHAETLLREARLQAALLETETALRLSPIRPSARALRGRLREALADVPGAYADLREASRLYPLNPAYASERDELEKRLPDPAARP